MTTTKELDRLLSNPDMTMREYEKSYNKVHDKVIGLLEAAMEFSEDDQLGDLLKAQEDKLEIVLAGITEGQWAEKEATNKAADKAFERISETTSPSDFHCGVHTWHDLVIPTFSGKPEEFPEFSDMFTALIKMKWNNLTEPEKCGLLRQSITTKEARRIVIMYAKGEKDFSLGLQVLCRRFGSPAVLYPIYSRNWERRSTTTAGMDSRDSENDVMMQRGGDTLSQFLSAHTLAHFDKRLQE